MGPPSRSADHTCSGRNLLGYQRERVRLLEGNWRKLRSFQVVDDDETKHKPTTYYPLDSTLAARDIYAI